MEAADLIEALRHLDAADALLAASGDVVLSARLSAVIEPLRERARTAGLGDRVDGLGHRVGDGGGTMRL